VKSTLNIGWVGQGDFGDEAMAFSIRSFVKDYLLRDQLTYYYVGDFYEKSLEGEINLDFIYRNSPNWFQRNLYNKLALAKFDKLIIGGGSIFHSENSIDWKKDIINVFLQKKSHKIAVIGVSLGPFINLKAEKKCGQLLDDIDVVMTRDSESAEIARSISKKCKVIASHDISLIGNYEKYMDGFSHEVNKEYKVGLMLMAFTKHLMLAERKLEIIDCYKRIIGQIIDSGKKVILYSMYIGDAYSDIAINQLLYDEFSSTGMISVEGFTGDIFLMIRSMASCEKIVSMRYHGIIFAYLLGIPFLSIEYDVKNQRFCRDINYPHELYCDLYQNLDMDVSDKIKYLLSLKGMPEKTKKFGCCKESVAEALKSVAAIIN